MRGLIDPEFLLDAAIHLYLHQAAIGALDLFRADDLGFTLDLVQNVIYTQRPTPRPMPLRVRPKFIRFRIDTPFCVPVANLHNRSEMFMPPFKKKIGVMNAKATTRILRWSERFPWNRSDKTRPSTKAGRIA